MFEEITQLIKKNKYEDALNQLLNIIDNSPNSRTSKFVNSIYQSKNNNIFKELGLYEFINISLKFISSNNLNIELFKKLNPDINIQKLLSDRNLAMAEWTNIFHELLKEAKTKNVNYINELSKISKVIRDKKLSITILGESGVGKSYMARSLHKISGGEDNNFQEMNCGSFSSEDRLNQNLLGWEQGSHSTASSTVKGKIELARGGTLFLDEIDRMPSATRDALITMIDTKKYQRLGSEKDIDLDLRFIFGTNKNLIELVSTQKLESDFYYRIKHVTFTIPPLRERKDDFPEIVSEEIKKINEELGLDVRIDLDALKWLSEFQWPGNYRELSAYLRVKINECLAEGNINLTYRFLKNKPPDENRILYQKDFENFQHLLRNYIMEFYSVEKNFIDRENEKNFLCGFIQPILAKIYIDDMDIFPSKNKSAMKFVALDGSKATNSTLHRMYKRYPLLVKVLFNLNNYS